MHSEKSTSKDGKGL